MSPAQANSVYQFGPFQLETAERRLRRGNEVVPLRAKVFDTLCALVERRGHLVTKNELFALVWPDTIVEENNLALNINALRKALRSAGWEEPFIETVPGQGYRFTAPVRVVSTDGSLQAVPFGTVTETISPPLIEREADLEILRACYERALAGQRQFVCLSGEAGIGKTVLLQRYLRELTEHADQPLLGYGQAIEYSGVGEPYMPVLDALARMCRERADTVASMFRHAPTWLIQLPWLVTDDRMADVRQRTLGSTQDRMVRELAEALEDLSRERLVVLALEDLQWSDPSTRALVAALARRPAPARLYVIVTVRTDDVDDTGRAFVALAQDLELRGFCRVVRPQPLSEAGVGQIISSRLPGLSTGTALTALTRSRTGGNPLFAEALTQFWRSSGAVQLEGNQWRVAGPEDTLGRGAPVTLRAMIQRRLESLPRDDNELLECASIIGTQFNVALLASIARRDLEDVENQCVRLSTAGWLHDGGLGASPDGTVAGTFGFVHALYQEVLYERVAPVRRARLHLAAARWLEQAFGDRAREHSSELARHFDAGLDHTAAIRFLRFAAERALSRSAHREAASYLRRGLELVERLPETPERRDAEFHLHAMLAPTALALEGFASLEAERSFARARELGEQIGRADQLASLLFGLAMMYELRGEYPQTEALLNLRLSLGQTTCEDSAPVDSETLMACSLFHQGRFAEALNHAESGVSLYDPHRHLALMAAYGENPGVACLGWAALSLWFLGQPDRAVRQIDEAVTLSEAPGHLYSLAAARAHGAHVHQLRRDLAKTSEWADAAFGVSVAQGYLYYLAFAQVLQGWVVAKADSARGVAQMREGLARLKAVGAQLDRPYLLALLAEAEIEAGYLAEANGTLDEAVALVRNSRTFFYEAELLRLKASLAQRSRKLSSEIETLLRSAIDLAKSQGAKSLELRVAVDLCRLLLDRGAGRQARRLLEPLYRTFDEGLNTPDLQIARSLLENTRGAGTGA